VTDAHDATNGDGSSGETGESSERGAPGGADETDEADEYDYRHVRTADLPDVPNPARHKTEIDEAVGATEFGFNVYEAAPGERVPWGYHCHPDHEELFYVVSGELVVGTPAGESRVGPDEAFFVPPGHPNRARAAGSEPCRLIAVGAPKATDEAVISEECPACGETTDREYETRTEDGEPVYALLCAGCGAEVEILRAGPG
jgi:mannose-6-phosphate isomerase-like protein (cupin superfamily)